jgi:hypothetical protein
MDRVVLERNGKRHELVKNQVTVENLRRLFQVNPTETWLRDHESDQAYFPEDDNFDLDDVVSFSTLIVEGPPLSSLPPPRSRVTISSTSPTATPSPSFRSVTAPKRTSSFGLKVVKAKIIKNGRRNPEFKPICQTYIDIVESTANLTYILDVIHQRWGPEYTLVTSDGIELEESPSIKGLSFWKSPRRKLFAVPRSEIACTPSRVVLSDSDEEDIQPPQHKKSRKDDKMNTILNEISDIKSNVSEMMSLSKDCRIPLGLRKITRDTFKCSICHIVPAKPPIIVTKCCKTILGCETCVNLWYSGTEALSKPCPVCKNARGNNETMLLRGLDDFLKKIRKAIQTEDEADAEEFPVVNLTS